MIMSTTVWIILAAAIVTFLTRIGGYAILSRFKTIHPRIDAGLRAVPAAVLTTLIIPPAVTNGWAEFVTIIIAGLVALRFNLLITFMIGAALILVLRSQGFSG